MGGEQVRMEQGTFHEFEKWLLISQDLRSITPQLDPSRR
jgi:hypothetical protein